MRALRVYGSVFLVAGVAFGVVMAAVLAGLFGAMDVGNGASDGLVVGLAGGLVFGLVVAAVLGTLQLAGSRGAPRGASLSPRQERQVPVVGGPDLADRIVAALRALPAELTAVDVPAGRYVASRGASWKSWGEEVVVQLSGDPARPVATVSSRPRVRTTLIDYGRGRRNVEQLATALGSAS